MTITRMTLHSFGRYKEVSLELDGGFNVLYGANGAGKSTLIQFLLWMLYDPENRKRGIREKIRERFRPWDGSALWGELEWTRDGVPYRMERYYDTASKKRFSVHHGITGQEVTEQFLPCPGQILFGFGQEAFLRTFFVGQLSTPFEKEGKEDELQTALMNLSTSGNEAVSAQKAQKTLEDAAKTFRLKTGRGGLIGAAEERLDRLNAALAERRQRESALHLKMQRLEQVERQVEEEKRAKESALAAAQERRNEQLDALAAEEQALQKALERMALQLEGVATERLSEAEEACRVLKNTQERLIQARAEAEAQKVRHTLVREQADATAKRNKTLFLTAGIGLALLGALGGALVHGALLFLIVAGACLIVAGILQKPKEIADFAEENTKQLDALTEQETAAKQVLVSVFGREVLEEDVRLAVTRLNEQNIKKLQLEELQKRRVLLEKSGVVRDGADLDRALLTELGSLTAELENGFAGLPDIRSLTEEIGAETERLTRLRQKHEALLLAGSWIAEQAEELRHSFGPKLNEAAAKVLDTLTEGNVSSVRIAGDYKMELTDDQGSHALDYFSNGTVDQAYLALRLGILDLLGKSSDGPLLLDDVFCQYDEKRLRAGLALLAQRASVQQILYCTCRKEEYPENARIINLDGHF